MRITLTFTILSLFLIFFLSCQEEIDENPKPTQPDFTYEQFETGFKNLDLTSGIRDVTLKKPNNQSLTFQINAPERSTNEIRPLIIALHWLDPGDQEAYKNFSNKLVYPALEKLDAFIVSPSGGATFWQKSNNQKKVKEILNLAKKHWPIDSTKIMVMGYSSGGGGSWYYAKENPQISVAIPIASSFNSPERIDVPMFVIHGSEDEIFPLEDIEYSVQSANEAGSSINLTVATGLIHNIREVDKYLPYLSRVVDSVAINLWK